MLEEVANGNTKSVGKVIDRGIRSLKQGIVEIYRVVWVKEVEAAERAGLIVTCQVIIKKTIAIGVEEEDRKRTWVTDAKECMKRGSIEIARAIYAHALTVFLTKKSIWLKATQLKKSHGTRESLDALTSGCGDLVDASQRKVASWGSSCSTSNSS
ncbi:hypothetical protein J5N97_013599 [Dioscorea zingiberensis]|uniref:Uncharacterized protein n=1 Tax=Dioscorea zingiberensis TaxID=325984 RepID=A0A9D5CQW8_9LILI|nr:hypothetical protein J5N97_013599 [Dioscorea zingiberensis]